MDKDAAKRILKTVLDFSGELGWSVSLVQASSSEAEATAYKKAVARVLFEIHTEILLRLWSEYPELMPDDLK